MLQGCISTPLRTQPRYPYPPPVPLLRVNGWGGAGNLGVNSSLIMLTKKHAVWNSGDGVYHHANRIHLADGMVIRTEASGTLRAPALENESQLSLRYHCALMIHPCHWAHEGLCFQNDSDHFKMYPWPGTQNNDLNGPTTFMENTSTDNS